MDERRDPAAAATVASDFLPWLVAAVHIAQALVWAQFYPQHRFDPDLLAYLVYFRQWLGGETTLHATSYFMHPKALLVFGLGPLANASAAFYCTAVASGALGALVYMIGREHFGRPTALLASAVLLLDPPKTFLTLRSSADLYVALFLFAAIWEADHRRHVRAAVCILGSALIKPVTLPCAAYFLTAADAGRRRWLAAAIPLLAVPLTLWSNHALLGSANATAHFFETFTALRGGDSVGADGVVYFALWTQLGQQRFPTTAVWGLIGLVLWVGTDRRRLTSPLLLMPMLFLFGYVALAAISPFMPFFRFFWPLEIWFLLFVVYGAVEAARRLAQGKRPVQMAVAGVVLWLLVTGCFERYLDYRRTVALTFEQGMAFAAAIEPPLRTERRPSDTVLAPLALLPYLMWTLPDAGRAHRIQVAERAALDRDPGDADWILYTPQLYASAAAREWVPQLAASGAYRVVARDETSALLARVTADRRAADAPVAMR